MATPNTDMIDAWLNEAAKGPYAIENQWTELHAQALVERMHDAITAPTAVLMTSLGLLLSMAETHALEGSDKRALVAASAIGQLQLARQLVQALNLQPEAHDFNRALAQDEHRQVLAALYWAREAGGLTMAQLRALNTCDAFTLRRQLKELTDVGVLQTGGEGASMQYVLSEDAEHAWERRRV